MEAAVEHRACWLRGHPAEVAWEADLAARLAGDGLASGAALPASDRPARGVDLRTVDLAPRRPRSGLERQLRDALGLTSRPEGAVIALPQSRATASTAPTWAGELNTSRLGLMLL